MCNSTSTIGEKNREVQHETMNVRALALLY